MLLLLLDFKQVKKAAENEWIEKVISKIIISQVNSNYQKSETAVTEEVSSVKADLKSQSEETLNSMKGKMGREVREAIKSEAEKINELS